MNKRDLIHTIGFITICIVIIIHTLNGSLSFKDLCYLLACLGIDLKRVGGTV